MHQLTWWQRAIVYQIYPWSFQDSNGDGIGDLPGIISRLDYLNGHPHSLGIDCIWLSPVYPSPMADFGYDVADYCNIDPRFGTLDDFKVFVDEAHRRGIRVIMDLVLNHTSDQHPWFVESRSSRHSAKRNWYCWADGKGLIRRPSNWNARFGGSSWTWDFATRQFYLHSFLKEQPDLNWFEPQVRSAMFDVARFWLDHGVDGFRLDAINWLGKDRRWPDNPRRFGWRGYTRQQHVYDRDQPLAHEVLRELRNVLAPYPDAVLIGEASADTPGGAQAYCGSGNDELHQVFDFRLLKSAWRADRFRHLIRQIDEATPVGSWPTVVLSNHDQSRHIDRYGRDGVPERRARAAAVLLFTLRGTPFLYYGEELGMRDGDLRYGDLRDPYTKRFWPFRKGRDPSRTPMQWDRSAHAGFTTGQPWLPVSANFPICNVDSQLQDSRSLLAVYRKLIQLRNASPALLSGTMTLVSDSPENCMVYQRLAKRGSGEVDRVLVAVNFVDRPVQSTLRSIGSTGTMIFSTDPNRTVPASFSPSRIELSPDEAVIIQFADSPFSESL